MDLTPSVPQGRQVIERYGAGRFTVSGVQHQGSILVWGETTLAWSIASVEEITLESLAPVIAKAADLDVLLIGCGSRALLLPKVLREGLRATGLVAEQMDSGAAARTFNILTMEDRRVAAALIAVE